MKSTPFVENIRNASEKAATPGDGRAHYSPKYSTSVPLRGTSFKPYSNPLSPTLTTRYVCASDALCVMASRSTSLCPCTGTETSALASVISVPGSPQPATPDTSPHRLCAYCVQSSSWTGASCAVSARMALMRASRSSEAIDSSSARAAAIARSHGGRVDAFLSVELERSHHWRIG